MQYRANTQETNPFQHLFTKRKQVCSSSIDLGVSELRLLMLDSLSYI